MKRVLTMRANIMTTSLLTAAVVGVTLFMSALESGSPLFKSDHESDGVIKNNEVQHGIAWTGRAVAQKGSNLSVLHFLFINNHEESAESDRVCQTGNCRAVPRYASLDADGENESRLGISAVCRDHRGHHTPAAYPGPATQPGTQLSYGNLQSSIDIVTQSDSAAGSSPACAAAAPGSSPAAILQIASYQGAAAAASGHYRLHDNHAAVQLLVCLCQALLAGQANPAGLTPSKIVFSKPDLSLATTGRPALYLLLHAHCRHCSRGVAGEAGCNMHPDRVTAGEVGL